MTTDICLGTTETIYKFENEEGEEENWRFNCITESSMNLISSAAILLTSAILLV